MVWMEKQTSNFGIYAKKSCGKAIGLRLWLFNSPLKKGQRLNCRSMAVNHRSMERERGSTEKIVANFFVTWTLFVIARQVCNVLETFYALETVFYYIMSLLYIKLHFWPSQTSENVDG